MVSTDRSMPQEAQQDLNSGTSIQSRSEFWLGRAAMTVTDLKTLRYLAAGNGPGAGPGRGYCSNAPGIRCQVNVTVYPQSLVISSRSSNPEDAWRFLQFAAGPEGAVAVVSQGVLPAYNAPEAKRAWFDRKPAPGPGTAAFFETTWAFTPHGAASTALQERWSVVVRAGSDLINKVMSGSSPLTRHSPSSRPR